MSKDQDTLTRREAWAAVLYALTVAAGFLWQILGVAVQPEWLHPNLWRLGSSINQVAGTFLLVSWFWRYQLGWAIVYALVMSIGSVMYVLESSNDISNFQLIDAPLRYSQIVFPIGCFILVFLLLLDFRLPPLFGYTFLFYSISWILLTLVLGNVMMQMMLGLVNDVGAMLAYGGLALWFVHLAWGYFTTHPDDIGAEPTQEPFFENER